MNGELHLVVLWEKARECEERILADIPRHVEVVAKLELSWPGDPTECFGRFYGAKLREAAGKTALCGGGPFLAILVRDTRPRYGWRETSRGSELVNLRLFAMKSRYRAWTGGGHKVHTTNSPDEARRDIFLLTGRTADDWNRGRCAAPSETLPGRSGWRSLRELLACLGETMQYVVLRNSEMLPDAFDPSIHGDIDILVRDAGECAGILGARKVFPEPHRVHYEVEVAGRPVRFDFRFVGDGYYDERWERAILEGGVVTDGVRRPSPEDAFYALVYHALFQKREIACDYGAKALALARAAVIGGDAFDDWIVPLGAFLRSRGYRITRPVDTSVYLDDLLPRWEEIAAEIEDLSPLREVRPFGLASRRVSPYLPTLLFSADLGGSRCFVKYSPVAPKAVAAEWEFPRRMCRAAEGLCPKPLFWHETSGGGAFAATELVEGETLEARLAGGRAIGAEEAARLSADMASIVRALKAAGIVHRDIRPANLMVTPEGRIKLIDFQFAVDRSRTGEYGYFAERANELLYPLGADFAVAPGVWNDNHAMAKCLRLLPQCAARDEAIAELEEGMSEATLRAKLTRSQRRRLKKEHRKMALRRLRHRLLGKKEKPHDEERFQRVSHMLREWD